MSAISLPSMRNFLGRSISSLNQNKLNGLLAEVDFRNYLHGLGFGDRVSPGGWIARTEGANAFGQHSIAFFPEIIQPGVDYPVGRDLPQPSHGLHTICATFHQSGILSSYCAVTVVAAENPSSIAWQAIQLGLPAQQQYQPFPAAIPNFRARARRHNFLRYNTNVATIPDDAVPEEFSKENVRLAFQNPYMCEISDIDGIFWGQQFTYPIEIKEKTVANSNKLGDFFGLDLGPFVKLAFYAAKRGNLHSIFVVREIDNRNDRNLVQWWFILFDHLAQFASWVPRGGGANMLGGQSTVVQVPRAEFQHLNAAALATL